MTSVIISSVSIAGVVERRTVAQGYGPNHWRVQCEYHGLTVNRSQTHIFSGNAALSSDQSTLIIDNLSNQCFDIYTVPSCHRKMAPLVFSSTLRFPKQCVFSDGAQVAICGSTTNKVYVVDVTSSDIIQTLVGGDGE